MAIPIPEGFSVVDGAPQGQSRSATIPPGFSVVDDSAPAPVPTGFSMANPDDIKARISTDPAYTPDAHELRALYDAEQNQTALQKTGSFFKGAAEGVGSTAHDLVVAPVKGVAEFANDPDAGRTAATLVEGPSSAASGIVGMLTKPVIKAFQSEQTNPQRAALKRLNYLVPGVGSYLANKFAPDSPAQTQQRFEDWSMDFLTKLAAQRGPGIAKSFTDAVTGDTLPEKANPTAYPEATRAVSTYVSLPMFEGGMRVAGVGAPAAAATAEKTSVSGLLAKAAANGGKVPGAGAPPSLAARATVAAGDATAATGKGMIKVASVPEDVAQWLTEKASGSPELAEKVSKYVDIGKTASVPLLAVGATPVVKAIAAVKALEGAGKIAEGIGSFASRLAQADATSPLGRLYALAQDSTAPKLMRELVSSPVVKLAAQTAGLAGHAATGAAEGAAVGAGLSALDGDNAEEVGANAGSGAVFGAGFGVLHGPAAALREKQLGAFANFVQAHLDAGISPETLKFVDDWTAMQAATMEKFAKGQKIRFATANDVGTPFASGGVAEGQAGFADKIKKILWLDPTKRKASEVLAHEFFHPIWQSQILSHPEVKKAFDQALSAAGKTLDQAKLAYVNAELGYKNDAVANAARAAERDAADPSWVYEEMLADSAGRNMFGADTLQAAQGQAQDNPLGNTIFKGFEPVFDAPPIRRLTLRAFKDYVDHRPGIDELAEQTAPLTKEDIGTPKTPFYRTAEGQDISPYGALLDDGKGGKKFVAWPASEMRRRLKMEQFALDEHFPKGTSTTQVPADALSDEGIAPWTRAALKNITAALQSGSALEGFYHRLNKENSATSTKSWAADVQRSLGNVQVSHQEGFPLTIKRSKNGNFLVDWASEAAMRQKAPMWADRHGDLSLDLWGSDQQAFFNDVKTYLENHRQGLPGDANGLGQQKRDVINAFLFGANKEFEAKNPLRTQLRKADRAGVFRSLRIDRMESLNPAETELSRPDWEKGKINLSPAADNGSGARLQELGAKEGRTPEEETELKALQAKSAQNNSREAFLKLWQQAREPEAAAAALTGQAAAEKAQFSPAEPKKLRGVGEGEWISGWVTKSGDLAHGFTGEGRGLHHPEILEQNPWLLNEAGYHTEEEKASALERVADFDRVISKQMARRGVFPFAIANDGFLEAYDHKLPKTAQEAVETLAKKLIKEAQFSPASKSIDNKAPDDIKSDRMKNGGKLPYAVGKPLKAFHFSDAGPDLDSVDPAFMRDKTTKFWGKTPKAFLWPKGSEQPIDSMFGNGRFPNRFVYQSQIDGNKIYDARDPNNDPLGYFDKWESDKEAIDKVILKNGYDGVVVGTKDGREVVVTFKKAKAKLIGVTDDDGNIRLGRKKLLPPKPKQEFVAPKTDWSKENDTDYANDDWDPDRDLPKYQEGGEKFSPMYDLESIVAMNKSKPSQTNDDPNYRESSYLRSGKGIVLHSANLRSTTFIKGKAADNFEKKYTKLQSKPARNALIESFFSPAAEKPEKPEYIDSPAIKLPDGKVVEGWPWHKHAVKAAEEAGYSAEDTDKAEVGFTTSTGRFVNRIAASRVAVGAGQLPKEWIGHELDAAVLATMKDPKFSPASEETPGFKAWTKGANIIKAGDSVESVKSGEPVVLEGFHGTTHDFRQFDPSKANIENDFGRAIYVTTSAEDVKHNYAGAGPDLTNRIERLAEQKFDSTDLKYGTPEYKRAWAKAKREAAKELTSHQGATMKVYVRLQNPLKLGGKGEPYWEIEYPEEDGVEPTGKLFDFVSALREVSNRFDDADPEEAVSEIYEGGKATDVIKKVRESQGLAYATDPDTGDMAVSEIIRAAIEKMGYDGIIDSTVDQKFGSGSRGKPMEGMNAGTAHVVAFKPEQVKSATGNRGTFDPESPDIRLSPAAESAPKPSPEPSKVVDSGPADKVAGRYAARIAALTAKNGGATFNPSTGKSYVSGKDPLFIASIYPDRSVILEPDQVTPAAIGQFIKANTDLLNNRENSIGTWKDPETGKVFLDVSFATPNRAMAEFAGKQYNQKTVWDLAQKKDIPTGGTGTTVPDMAPPAERLGMLKELFDESQKVPTTPVRGPLSVAVPAGAGAKANVRSLQAVETLDLDHVLTSVDMQPFARKVLQHFRKLPGFHNLPASIELGLHEIAKRMQANIKALYELSTLQERNSWRKWYDYANDMSKRWGAEFNLSPDVVAAINARLSPQMDWYKNVTLTRTILQTLKDNPKFTEGDRTFLEEKFSQIKKASDRNKWMGEINAIKNGTPLSDMNNAQAGAFLRSHNELKGILKTHDHELKPVAGVTGWSKPFDDLRSVVSIYRDPSARNVHEELGKNHKVRSFYNNHVAPESPKWTTIDTHAVAAANMYPLGGSDAPVKANFGNPNHKNSGYNGTYFLYQHAYEQLAKEVGLLPREVQSIVWEKIRQVLSPARKRALQDNPSPVKAIYADLRAGKVTPEEARAQLLEVFKNVDQKDKNATVSNSEH